MKIQIARNNPKKIVIRCESEAEARLLQCGSFNVGLTATSDPLKFTASAKQIPEEDFEKFKEEILDKHNAGEY